MRSCGEPIACSRPRERPSSSNIADVSRGLREELEALRRVDRRLAALRESLAPTTVAAAELRGVVETVRRDLLADAIDTLSLVAGDGP